MVWETWQLNKHSGVRGGVDIFIQKIYTNSHYILICIYVYIVVIHTFRIILFFTSFSLVNSGWVSPTIYDTSVSCLLPPVVAL